MTKSGLGIAWFECLDGLWPLQCTPAPVVSSGCEALKVSNQLVDA